MLTSLLPGIRHLRAPLAAGYILLVAAWIGLGSQLRAQATKSPLIEDLVAVGSWLDKGAVLAVATFCAYVIGIISTATNGVFRPNIHSHSYSREIGYLLEGKPMRFMWLKAKYAGPPSVIAPIVQVITDALEERFATNAEYSDDLKQKVGEFYNTYQKRHPELTPVFSRDTPIEEHIKRHPSFNMVLPSLDVQGFYRAGEVLEDLDPTAQRLIGVDQELFNEFDRVRSEADFRLSLILPLSILFMTIAWRSSPFFLIGLAACVLLARIGQQEYLHSYELLTRWILAGRIKSPALERARTEFTKPDVSFHGHRFIADNFFQDERDVGRLRRLAARFRKSPRFPF